MGLCAFGDRNLMKAPILSISHASNNYKIIKMRLNQLIGRRAEISKGNILHPAVEIRLCIFMLLKVKICCWEVARLETWSLNSM
jgi:hypothetical protein